MHQVPDWASSYLTLYHGTMPEASMYDHPPGHTSSAPSQYQPPYPLHKVVAALDPARLDQVEAALATAGLNGDRIDTVTASDMPSPDVPIGGAGLRGFFTRLGLSLGDDLDAIEQARSALRRGHALILVAVRGDAERKRVQEILREQGGHSMRYFGHWTITALEGGSH
jgi:hypothetical protein